MKTPRVYTVFLVTAVFLSLVLQSSMVLPHIHGAYSGTIYSKYSTSTPVLDGTIGTVEWSGAKLYTGVGDGGIFDVYFMHGQDNFYVGVRVQDSTMVTTDRISIFFDEGATGTNGGGSGDGVLTEGQEDDKVILGDGSLRDGYYHLGTFYLSSSPSEINFEAAIAYHATRWEAEYKIPYVGVEGLAGDMSDLTISKNDTIGILVRLRSGSTDLTYPAGASEGIVTSWLALKFDGDTPTVSNVNYDPTQPGPNDAITVTATVADATSGVKDAILMYSINSGASWISVPMTGTGVYSATIPKQAEGTTVQFKILARDNVGFEYTTATSSFLIKSLLFGMDPLLFYALIAVVAVAIVGVVVMVTRKPKPPPAPAYAPPPAPAAPPTAFCPTCGTPIPTGTVFCPKCGRRIQ